MFSVTSKTTIGLIALLDLAERFGKDLVQIKDIVERRNVPKNYLEQILNTLTKNRIINGIRGRNGGYELNRNPADITLLHILEAIEGKIQINDSKDITAMHGVFKEVENRIKDSFSISLAELVKRQQKMERLIDFQI